MSMVKELTESNSNGYSTITGKWTLEQSDPEWTEQAWAIARQVEDQIKDLQGFRGSHGGPVGRLVVTVSISLKDD